jgi:hypothetical protein
MSLIMELFVVAAIAQTLTTSNPSGVFSPPCAADDRAVTVNVGSRVINGRPRFVVDIVNRSERTLHVSKGQLIRANDFWQGSLRLKPGEAYTMTDSQPYWYYFVVADESDLWVGPAKLDATTCHKEFFELVSRVRHDFCHVSGIPCYLCLR